MPVRRVHQPVQMVEAVALGGDRGEDVLDDHVPALPADAEHLGDRARRVAEVVERAAAAHEVERLVDERQRGGVALLQHDVAYRTVRDALRTERQQRRREVEADHGTDLGRELLGHVRGAARDLEHDHGRVEGLEPAERAARAGREDRVRT